VPEPDLENWQAAQGSRPRPRRSERRDAAQPRSGASRRADLAADPGAQSGRAGGVSAAAARDRLRRHMFALRRGVRLRGEHPLGEQASPGRSASTGPRSRPSSSRAHGLAATCRRRHRRASSSRSTRSSADSSDGLS
jgi:hypothetical protein